MLVLMFLGAVFALRTCFTMVGVTRDAAFAAAIIRTEIEDLRHTPWPILNDPFLTPPERAITLTPSTTGHGAPVAAKPFTSTRLIFGAEDLGSDSVRVLVAVSWIDSSGTERVHCQEATLSSAEQKEPAAPQLAQTH